MSVKALFLCLALGAGCGGPGVYAACEDPGDCDGAVPEETEAVCLPKENWGFCTWTCDVDADCANDVNEDYDYLCSSFESSSDTYCFPSCLEEGPEELDACPNGYTCRSSGGGEDNRRVCFPVDDI